MGCNCGSKQSSQIWIYTSRDGTVVKEYKTEVEARAAVIRAGGGKITARAA